MCAQCVWESLKGRVCRNHMEPRLCSPLTKLVLHGQAALVNTTGETLHPAKWPGPELDFRPGTASAARAKNEAFLRINRVTFPLTRSQKKQEEKLHFDKRQNQTYPHEKHPKAQLSLTRKTVNDLVKRGVMCLVPHAQTEHVQRKRKSLN